VTTQSKGLEPVLNYVQWKKRKNRKTKVCRKPEGGGNDGIGSGPRGDRGEGDLTGRRKSSLGDRQKPDLPSTDRGTARSREKASAAGVGGKRRGAKAVHPLRKRRDIRQKSKRGKQHITAETRYVKLPLRNRGSQGALTNFLGGSSPFDKERGEQGNITQGLGLGQGTTRDLISKEDPGKNERSGEDLGALRGEGLSEECFTQDRDPLKDVCRSKQKRIAGRPRVAVGGGENQSSCAWCLQSEGGKKCWQLHQTKTGQKKEDPGYIKKEGNKGGTTRGGLCQRPRRGKKSLPQNTSTKLPRPQGKEGLT